MLTAALEYLAHGVPLFPVHGVKGGRCLCGRKGCENAGKHPIGSLVPHGFKDATTDEELASKVATQRPEDVRAGLQQLRTSGSVTPAPSLALTDAGTAMRERIEADTDRYFFGAWPDAVGTQAAWMVDRLTAVNAGLA